MRHFNVAGPCVAAEHYMLPPEARLPDLLPLVEQKQYFVVHSARQTGKTTAMLAFADRLRGNGYAALYVSLEQSQGFESVEEAEALWVAALGWRAQQQWPDLVIPVGSSPVGDRLREWLAAFCRAAAPRPVVVLLDECDVVGGPALVSLLRQLRAGFTGRGPGVFPSAVGLVGMRDLRDYLAHAKDGEPVNPGSPFNVKIASLTLRAFTELEVAALYRQHTADTGQPFAPDAVARAFEWTRGQPYLVNALARHCVEHVQGSVGAADIDAAKEALIASRTTHLDSLARRLDDPRVARILQAVLLGDVPFSIPYDHDDFDYVVDLGLIVRGPLGAEPANPLYREVLARQLALRVQEAIRPPWWRWSTADGRLDFPALVDAFLAWWRENEGAIHAHGNRNYPEALPHLAFMAFLQRVVNGGGSVVREYAADRKAIDLVVQYRGERFVVELKRVHSGGPSVDVVKDAGADQLAGYLALLGEPEGWLLLFDQRRGRTWDERLWAEERVVDGRRLHLRGA